MLDLCKYKDILGKPGTGAHSYRVFNVAIVDVILTIILGFVLHRIIVIKYNWVSIWWVMIGVFLFGIVSHRLFCVRTTVDKLLFS